MNVTLRLLSAGTACAILLAQQTSQAPALNPAEVVSHDSPATFRTKVNLVLVPVVVRDSHGVPVGDLKKEDFLLFDKGKPQVITKFSVEKAGAKPVQIEDLSGTGLEPGAPVPPVNPAAPVIAERYIAYLFDDVHLNVADLMRSRDAADRQLATSLQATLRAAIYATSGETMQDFTDDPTLLHQMLLKLKPHAKTMQGDCPPVTYYMGDLIVNKNDQQALTAATQDAMACMGLDPTQIAQARQAAQTAAQRALTIGDEETRLALGTLKNVVRRLSALPGQRTLVFVSPGFITPFLESQVTDIIDAAIRAGVTVNALDARGLYVAGSEGDASQGAISIASQSTKDQYARASASLDAGVLAEVAYGTGGTFFENSNDLVDGFKRTAGTPEYSYLLGFSPQNLKTDGSYHSLKVKVKEPGRLTLQARRGYYAPKHLADPAQEAKREIEEALFSREVVHDIPAELHTQFFKTGEFDAKLSVLARIDVKQLRYRKVDGRNWNSLTVVCGLFDRNGNFVSAVEKTVEMRLKDDTLEKRLAGGVTVRTSFDVKSGAYVIRMVARDDEGQLMAAQNGSIEIP